MKNKDNKQGFSLLRIVLVLCLCVAIPTWAALLEASFGRLKLSGDLDAAGFNVEDLGDLTFEDGLALREWMTGISGGYTKAECDDRFVLVSSDPLYQETSMAGSVVIDAAGGITLGPVVNIDGTLTENGINVPNQVEGDARYALKSEIPGVTWTGEVSFVENLVTNSSPGTGSVQINGDDVSLNATNGTVQLAGNTTVAGNLALSGTLTEAGVAVLNQTQSDARYVRSGTNDNLVLLHAGTDFYKHYFGEGGSFGFYFDSGAKYLSADDAGDRVLVYGMRLGGNILDPAAGTDVGDRDYNDGRYTEDTENTPGWSAVTNSSGVYMKAGTSAITVTPALTYVSGEPLTVPDATGAGHAVNLATADARYLQDTDPGENMAIRAGTTGTFNLYAGNPQDNVLTANAANFIVRSPAWFKQDVKVDGAITEGEADIPVLNQTESDARYVRPNTEIDLSLLHVDGGVSDSVITLGDYAGGSGGFMSYDLSEAELAFGLYGGGGTPLTLASTGADVAGVLSENGVPVLSQTDGDARYLKQENTDTVEVSTTHGGMTFIVNTGGTFRIDLEGQDGLRVDDEGVYSYYAANTSDPASLMNLGTSDDRYLYASGSTNKTLIDAMITALSNWTGTVYAPIDGSANYATAEQGALAETAMQMSETNDFSAAALTTTSNTFYMGGGHITISNNAFYFYVD
jgi:hypothetical protein